MDWQIERLATHHDRSAFSCGEPGLDEFLRKLASQYERRDLARTYVAVVPPDPRIIGYYSLSSGAVAFQSVPPAVSRKLPRHPVPVAHLGRLAVDRQFRGRGLGADLLIHALNTCLQISAQMGLYAVEVYALRIMLIADC